jgi:hypothetical protein
MLLLCRIVRVVLRVNLIMHVPFVVIVKHANNVTTVVRVLYAFVARS